LSAERLRPLPAHQPQSYGRPAGVFDITDPYCTPIACGIQNALYQASYVPLRTDVQNDRTRFERSLEMLLGPCVEGLVVIANWLFMDVNLLADLEKNSTPTVMIGREPGVGSVSSVIVDNEAGGFAALEHLYSLGTDRSLSCAGR